VGGWTRHGPWTAFSFTVKDTDKLNIRIRFFLLTLQLLYVHKNSTYPLRYFDAEQISPVTFSPVDGRRLSKVTREHLVRVTCPRDDTCVAPALIDAALCKGCVYRPHSVLYLKPFRPVWAACLCVENEKQKGSPIEGTAAVLNREMLTQAL
jgi:hypothetical protein